MRYDVGMNWKQIIAEIQEYGHLTQDEIGKACDTTQSTISSIFLRKSSEPSYSLGKKLETLHKKVSRRVKAVV